MKASRPCGIPLGTTRRASHGVREVIHARRSRNRCKGESCDSLLTAGADQRFRGSQRGTPPGRGSQRGFCHAASPGGGSASRWRRWARSKEAKSLCLDKAATSVPATARLGIFAAGPARAGEEGGPTAGRLAC